MINVENIETWGFEHAIRGMRNPMNSWDKSDSVYDIDEPAEIHIGDDDMELMQRLYKAGTEHRKYLRQIFVSMDITAPIYWWKEFDTYKVGTVSNSCSTMHKIAAKKFELDDFSHEHLHDMFIYQLKGTVIVLNHARDKYLETRDKDYWRQMIQLLPSSYNQKRTITMNYENVVNMIGQRCNHKLDEWREFVEILKDLPYVSKINEPEEIIINANKI